MISWLSTLIQRRGKIIFSVLLAIIIVAFVFTIGAGPGLVSKDKSTFQKDFYGIDLNDRGQLQYLQDSAMISNYLNGRTRMNDAQFEQQMLGRQALLYLADKMSVPAPDESKLESFLKKLPAFQGENGEFDPAALNGFLSSIQMGGRYDQGFIDRVIRQDFRLGEVTRLIAEPGFLVKEEIAKGVARERTNWSVSILSYPFDSYQPTIEIDEEALKAFYAENSFRYERPEEFSVSFVEFTADQVQEEIADPNDQELRVHYLRNQRKFSDAEKEIEEKAKAEAEEGSEPVLDMFNLLRDKILESYKLEKKAALAAQIANDFTYYLFDRQIAYDSSDFRSKLREYGLNLKHIPPFSAKPQTQLTGIVPSALYQQALMLDSSRYFTDVVSNPEQTRFYVAFLEGKTPAETPELDAIRDIVTQDYRLMRKNELFVEKGKELSASLREALKQEGATVEAAAETLGLKVQSYADFTIRELPEGMNFRLVNEAETMKVGETSDMITLDNTGFWIHVADKKVPEITEDDSEYAGMLTALESYSGAIRLQGLINDLISAKMPSKG